MWLHVAAATLRDAIKMEQRDNDSIKEQCQLQCDSLAILGGKLTVLSMTHVHIVHRAPIQGSVET